MVAVYGNRRANRGTVLLLVVVCLALLAVLATVYLVVARSDRGNTSAINMTVDMDFAGEGVQTILKGQIVRGTLDSQGTVLGKDASGTSGKKARDYDIPETGATSGSSAADGTVPDQPWLTLATDGAAERWTRLQAFNGSAWSTTRFNPSSGAFDLGLGGPEVAVMNPTGSADSVYYLLPASTSQGIRYRFAVRIVDLGGLANLNFGNTDSGQDDANGRYLSSYQLYRLVGGDAPGLLHTNPDFPKGRGGGSFATTYPLLLSDWHQIAMTNELPHTWDGSLVRTVRPVELFDHTDELELRAKDSRRLPYAARPESLWPVTLAENSSTRDLVTTYSYDRNIRPRVETLGSFAAYVVDGQTVWPTYPARVNVNSYLPPAPVWQGNRVYLAGDVATGPDGKRYICTMSHYGYATAISYDLSSGSSPAVPSSYAPTAPGVDPGASAYWDYTPAWTQRNWMPGQRCVYNNVVYICRYPIPSSSGGRNPQADDPSRVKLSADPGNTNNYGGFYWRAIPAVQSPLLGRSEILASTAANIASVMGAQLLPTSLVNPNTYSAEEQRAFAVNYLTYRFSSGKVPASGLYYLPAGPSFLDASGLCVRGGTWDSAGATFTPDCRDFTSGNANELKSETANKMYVGYAAQPYINEVVAEYDATGTLVDAGIELLNPHEVGIDFQQPGYANVGWKLYVYPSGGGAVTVIDLGALFVNAGVSVGIPQQGVAVITEGAALQGVATANGAAANHNQVYAGLRAAMGSTGGTLVLTRPYVPRGQTSFAGGSADAIVDAFVYPAWPVVNSAVYSTQRANGTGAGVNLHLAGWSNVLSQTGDNDLATPLIARGDTLGVANGAVAVVPALPNPMPVVVPEDRFAVAGGYVPDTNFSLLNLADFNAIMRVTNTMVTNGTPMTAANSGGHTATPLSARFNALFSSGTAPMPNSEYPYEAAIRFDFKAVPGFYANPQVVTGMGDPRAAAMLDFFAAIDRGADLLDVGEGVNSVNKVRLPGRINVNTAAPNVLKAVHAGNMSDGFVANIVAYRNRSGSYGYTYNGSPAFDFAGVSPAPTGVGIRGTGELYYVLNPQGGPAAGYTSIKARDLPWARLADVTTTRSDAFVAYVMIEALRTNSSSHNNSTDWYGSATDDPADTSTANRRMATRRMMVLLDRSVCNYVRTDVRFVMPRVVAIRDLPP